MTAVDLITIAEAFTLWLHETSIKYGIDKDDLQESIKQFLM